MIDTILLIFLIFYLYKECKYIKWITDSFNDLRGRVLFLEVANRCRNGGDLCDKNID